MSSFSVVEFVDEVDSDGCKKVDIIPSEWFHGTERKLCWWPPASLVNVTKAVKEGTPPASNWTLCNVRVMGNPATYANAKAKLHQSEYSSELMDNDNGMRKRKPSVKLMQSQLSSHTESSEPSDSDEELPPTPPEQLLKRPSGKNNSVVASPRSAARSATRAVAASPAAWSAASPTCEAMFSKVLAVLEEVKKTQLVHSKMLNALLKQKNGSVAEVPERVVLPLKTQDDVEALNGRLEDCSLMSDVTTANIDITITMVGASHTVRVNPQDTVGSLKIKIQSMLGVDPQRQRLVFINGQKTPLNDDSKPISYYGLQHGSQVSLLVTEPPPAPTQVFLRNEKGQLSTYDIRLDETVSIFKNRVEKREGVPASQQRLIHQGRVMQGGKLEDYNIRNHSTIDLTLRLGCMGTTNMDITVNMVGASHTVRVNPQDTVGSLKIKIQSMLGVDPQRQRLVFRNGQRTPLNDDSKPISYYGLQHGSQVSLLVTEPPPPALTQVFLRNEKGQLSTYNIRLNETVSNFKNRVEKREGVPASQQRLIHQGREMQGGKLEDYYVRHHSTIDLTLRLRG